MGLGIHKDKSMTVYTLPLIGMGDKMWNDNTWICEHLRQLANKIEETEFNIFSIGVEMNPNHEQANPSLVIKGWEMKNDLFKPPKANTKKKESKPKITPKEFNLLTDREKWNIFSNLKDVVWCCANCGVKTETPASQFMGSLVCGECDAELTRRTNGGQNNPFGWTFKYKKS